MPHRNVVALLLLVLLSASALAQPVAPATPSSPNPPDGAVGVPVDVTLSWASDPKAKKFEIYLGTTNPAPLVATTNGTPSYTPATLTAGTTYYWRVTARGTGNTSAAGPVWTFTTGAAVPPGAPSNPAPQSGAVGVPVDTTLSWTAAAGATGYDVAFGSSNPPPIVSTNQTATSYQPGTLAAQTLYYWRVTARGAGGNTSAPLWNFTTAAPSQPPSATLGRLKVMTWNIQSGTDASNAEAVDAQVALMVDANADVIGLQEVTVAAGRDLRALYKAKLEAATGLTWNTVWAPAPFPSGVNPEGNLVLTRLPIVSWSIKQFDVVPNDPSWLGAKRAAARLEVRVNGRNVNLFITHLDPTVSLRTAQLSEFLAWVNTYPPPRIVGGDFNMMSSEADYMTTTSQFDDAWTSLVERYQAPPGPDPGYTKDVRGIAPWTGQPGRIDYWFLEMGSATVQPTEIAVLHTRRSDHHAVVMWVRVQ